MYEIITLDSQELEMEGEKNCSLTDKVQGDSAEICM